MKRSLHNRPKLALALASMLLLVITACSLDVTNPNSASEDQVLTTRTGVIALAVGLQQNYAVSVMEPVILTPGVTSGEIAINSTFTNLLELQDGGNQVTTGNGNVLALWARPIRVMSMANDLIASAPKVTLDPGTRSGIIALAHLYKAMAMGFLAQAFEQAPIDLDKDGRALFRPRQEVLAGAIGLLDAAAQLLAATPASNEFNTQILGRNFDLVNTINAMRARYNLMAGRHQPALDIAGSVNPAAKSVFTYDDRNPNPIYQLVFLNRNYAARDNFGSALVEPGDGRLGFYLTPADKTNPSPYNLPIDDLKGFFDAISKAIPVYLPGEMNLIKAEALVRLGRLPEAVNEINAVRTKTTDPFGVAAGLPAYSGAVTETALLEEIYRQRSAELFMTGLHLEDSRRLSRPGPLEANPERNRNFYPYPDQERLNNPNTPPDPNI
ncbi:RagB/SusD family nutrient uptake outer membrane protein [bacterium]|nr:RagB/SusD family nutrient uptake outer membrane protein [bacterium]